MMTGFQRPNLHHLGLRALGDEFHGYLVHQWPQDVLWHLLVGRLDGRRQHMRHHPLPGL